MFNIRKKLKQIWNDVRVSKWWQNVLFWVNYSFNKWLFTVEFIGLEHAFQAFIPSILTPDITIECCSHDSITLLPSTRTQHFSIGFWLFAVNKLCDQQMFMILTRFVHHDHLHKWTQMFWILKPKYSDEFCVVEWIIKSFKLVLTTHLFQIFNQKQIKNPTDFMKTALEVLQY